MAFGCNSGTWECTESSCKKKNSIKSDWCEKCGKTWSCTACTYVNQIAHPDCVVCQTACPVNPNAANSNQVKCPSCTFEQSKDNITCEICENPMQSNGQSNGQFNQGSAFAQYNGGKSNNNSNNNSNKNSKNDGFGYGFGYGSQYGGQFGAQYASFGSNNVGNNNSSNDYEMHGYHGVSSFGYHEEKQQQNNSYFPFDFNSNSNSNSSHSSSKSKHKHKHKKSKQQYYNNNNNNNNNDYNQDNGKNKTMFKDVKDIITKDANDKEKGMKEANELVGLYKYVYEIDLSFRYPNKNKYKSNRNNMNDLTLRNTLMIMIKYAPKYEDKDDKSKNEMKDNSCNNDKTCSVCYTDYDNDCPQISMKGDCNHRMICRECFKQQLKIKIKDNDCTPWLICPAPECTANIHVDLLMQHCDSSDLYHFASIFLMKHLKRNPNWVECQTKNCDYGWIWPQSDKTKTKRLDCKACGKTQNIQKKEIDAELEKLIKSGAMKKCPKCEFPTMKDKGMCNIMHCARCDIYWNWRTLEMGNNSKTLKNRARGNGTLWEPGELAYQQKLQRDDLPAFIKLLERNGIKYNPNYQRGTG